jgi:hypothetical protein
MRTACHERVPAALGSGYGVFLRDVLSTTARIDCFYHNIIRCNGDTTSGHEDVPFGWSWEHKRVSKENNERRRPNTRGAD